MMNNIAAVVVTYNRKDLLKKCISHLQKQTQKLDILIIDNASTDGTQDLFTNEVDNIKYFNTGSNLGGAGGFSYGIKKAVELGYDYLWILDDDTLPMPTALEQLVQYAKKLNDDFGFLSSKALWKDESICNMNIQKISKWKRVTDFDTEHTIQYASFVSLFLQSEVVKKVGLPYKEFFIWADDWEYTRRISKQFKSYYVPSSVVHHWCNTNVGANIVDVDESRIDRFKYMYRNDVVMYRQDGIEGRLYLTIRNTMHKIKVIKSGKNTNEKLKIMHDATKEGNNFYPEIEFPERG